MASSLLDTAAIVAAMTSAGSAGEEPLAENICWYVCKKCPREDACKHSVHSWKKAACYAESLEECIQKVTDHLVHSGLHKMKEADAKLEAAASEIDVEEWPADWGQQKKDEARSKDGKKRKRETNVSCRRDQAEREGDENRLEPHVHSRRPRARSPRSPPPRSNRSNRDQIEVRDDRRFQLGSVGGMALRPRVGDGEVTRMHLDLVPSIVGDRMTLTREQVQTAVNTMERASDAAHHAQRMFASGALAFDREAANIDSAIATMARVLRDARAE